MIELQSGEKLVGEPHIGDSIRWNLSPAIYGNGESSTSVIVLKPQSPGLDTNLLITTDRRADSLPVFFQTNDDVARGGFSPSAAQDKHRKKQQPNAGQKEPQEQGPRPPRLPA